MANEGNVNESLVLKSDSIETEGPVNPPPGPIIAWPFPISMSLGSSSIQERLSYKTEIQTSRSGKEIRSSKRSFPRKSMNFAAVLSEDMVPTWHGFVHQSLTHNVVVPQSLYLSVPAEVPAGTSEIYLDNPPEWMLPGMVVVLGDIGEAEALLIEAVSGNLTYFSTSTLHTWSVGTTLSSGLTGVLDQPHQAEMITPRVASVDVEFRVRAMTEILPEPPTPVNTFHGRELFLLEPTWSRSLSQSFSRTVDELDYGVGPTYRYSPALFTSDVFQNTYANVGSEERELIENLFHRVMGRRGEFYAPTWMPDLTLKEDVSGTSLRVVGIKVFLQFANSLTHRAIYIKLKNGTTYFRKILSITEVENDSLIQVDSAITIQASQVSLMGWLLLRRLASDDMTLQHFPSGASSIQLGLMTLEALAPEEV